MLDIIIRPLQPSDCIFLFNWRTLKDTVEASVNPPPTWEKHCQYFEELLYKQNHGYDLVRVADIGGVPVGIVVADANEHINIMVSLHYRRQGVAVALLKSAQTGKYPLRAFVKKGNKAAEQLFLKCNFCLLGMYDDGYLFYWKATDSSSINAEDIIKDASAHDYPG